VLLRSANSAVLCRRGQEHNYLLPPDYSSGFLDGGASEAGIKGLEGREVVKLPLVREGWSFYI
jgi:hypothetical protein